jgi:hypothetical protein
MPPTMAPPAAMGDAMIVHASQWPRGAQRGNRTHRALAPLRLVIASLVVGLTSVAVVVLPAQVASAASDTVTTCSGDATVPGSLPYEVANAASGDTINFSVSCPAGSPIVLSRTINVAQNLDIEGTGPSSVVVSGNDAVGIFSVASTSTISGLTVEDGKVVGRGVAGGGIANGGTLTLNDVSLSSNVSVFKGGGIFNSGTLTLNDSTLSGNSATIASSAIGGGIINSGSMMITSSTLTDNVTRKEGGGIVNNGTLTVTSSTLSGNSSGDNGGGITNRGSLTITNSTLSKNVARDYGGGIYNTQGDVTLSGSTISGNDAGRLGGGLMNEHRSVVTNSTLLDNSRDAIWSGNHLAVTDSTISDNSGAAIANYSIGHFRPRANIAGSTLSGNSVGIYDYESRTKVMNSTIADNGDGISNDLGGLLTVRNSTVSDNSGFGIVNHDGTYADVTATIIANTTSGHDCKGKVVGKNYNLADDSSCDFGARTDLRDTPAGLDPSGLQNHGGPTETIALEPGSDAIGAVKNASFCSTTDQRGVARPTPCDIGAYQTS